MCLACVSIGCQKSIVFHRDSKGQGTPLGLQNTRVSKRNRKADINICGEGRAESIVFHWDPGGQGTPSLGWGPRKGFSLRDSSEP